MKRIANSVCVATLLSTMQPQMEVKIMDVDTSTLPFADPLDSSETDKSYGLAYTVDEILHKIDNIKIAKAQIYRTCVNEGLMLIVIDTKHEVY